MRKPVGESDSQRRTGGRIPGSPGSPAFTLTGPEPSSIPVLIAVPHAGRGYTDALVRAMRSPGSSALKLEDRYVDRLAAAIAAETGAMLLVAHAPRAMIDLNRAPDDVDWEMFGRPERGGTSRLPPSRRARSGLGLIPRRLPGIGELWKRRHGEDELAARISQVHEPYHAELARVLSALRDRWGAALLIDLHSMPPVIPPAGQTPPDFVIGDRFGDACHGSLVAAAFSYFGEVDCVAAHNRPYAGGYVLERHSSPARGVHGLQVEIDRCRYLDSRLAEPGRGFGDVVLQLAGLVRRLAPEVAALGQAGGQDSGGSVWPEAAE